MLLDVGGWGGTERHAGSRRWQRCVGQQPPSSTLTGQEPCGLKGPSEGARPLSLARSRETITARSDLAQILPCTAFLENIMRSMTLDTKLCFLLLCCLSLCCFCRGQSFPAIPSVHRGLVASRDSVRCALPTCVWNRRQQSSG